MKEEEEEMVHDLFVALSGGETNRDGGGKVGEDAGQRGEETSEARGERDPLGEFFEEII